MSDTSLERLHREVKSLKQQIDDLRRRRERHEPASNPDPRPLGDRIERRDLIAAMTLLAAPTALAAGASEPARGDTVITNEPTPATCIWRGPQDATGYTLLNLGLLDLDDQRQGSDEVAGIANVDGKLYRVAPQ